VDPAEASCNAPPPPTGGRENVAGPRSPPAHPPQAYTGNFTLVLSVRTFRLLGEKGEVVVFSRPLRALRAA